ncbi:MAG: hypothetical protein AAF004_02085 [Pseudomonadota bacterium]
MNNDLSNSVSLANPGRRFLIATTGVVLSMAGGYGLYVLTSLIQYVMKHGAGDANAWTDYGLVGASLALALIAGLSLLWSALKGRRRDVIPGPTLYLLGLCLAVLGAQAALIAGTTLGWLGVIAGIAIIVIEYRSDTI